MYIHSFGATNDIALHAMILHHHRRAPLVAFSDLVLECNNRDIPTELLHRYLALYPQQRKRLVRSSESTNAAADKCAALLVLAACERLSSFLSLCACGLVGSAPSPSLPINLTPDPPSVCVLMRAPTQPPGVNEGYVCAQLRALASHLAAPGGSGSGAASSSSSAAAAAASAPFSWWRYEWILLTNPDVFPTSEGLHRLHMRLLARPDTCFFVFQVAGARCSSSLLPPSLPPPSRSCPCASACPRPPRLLSCVASARRGLPPGRKIYLLTVS